MSDSHCNSVHRWQLIPDSDTFPTVWTSLSCRVCQCYIGLASNKIAALAIIHLRIKVVKKCQSGVTLLAKFVKNPSGTRSPKQSFLPSSLTSSGNVAPCTVAIIRTPLCAMERIASTSSLEWEKGCGENTKVTVPMVKCSDCEVQPQNHLYLISSLLRLRRHKNNPP